MASRSHRTLAVLTLAGLLMVGCADGGGTGQPPDELSETTAASSGPTSSMTSEPPRTDAGSLVERALTARAADDAVGFAASLSAAVAACSDPDGGRRLGEVAAIADRWAEALQYARPKAQAVTETQLAQVDWEALVAACDPA